MIKITKIKKLPTGTKITWTFIMLVVAYEAMSHILWSIHFFQKHGFALSYDSVISLLFIILSAGSFYTILQLRRSGMKWLWTWVIAEIIVPIVPLVGGKISNIIFTIIFSAIGIVFGLLIVKGYREVLKRAEALGVA
ncbi:MAG: hypothetical protein HY092_01750 [Candidatus Kerfeldbacteria bacterium]|nr:hypothetical protein [Candidatus Kerfeldbacteria bacterium]